MPVSPSAGDASAPAPGAIADALAGIRPPEVLGGVVGVRPPSRRVVLGGLAAIAFAAPVAALAGIANPLPRTPATAAVAPAVGPRALWMLTIARGSTRVVLPASALARFPSASVRAVAVDGTAGDWSGVLVGDLLAAVGVTASARLRVHSTGSSAPADVRWSLSEQAASVVAIARDGLSLAHRDGFSAALALDGGSPVVDRLSLIEVLL